MAAPTPRAAANAFAANTRAALQCIAQVEVLSSEATLGLSNNLQIMPFRRPVGSTLLLRKPDRAPYLQLEVIAQYSVIESAETDLGTGFDSAVTMDMYAVFDLSGRELFAYHWHPASLSVAKTPHFHASVVPPVRLPERPGSPNREGLILSRIHFPTHHIRLSELVRFLITELGVGPRRADWETLLDRIEHPTS